MPVQIINKSDITIETYQSPSNIAWIEDKVEVYWENFTIIFNDIVTEEQAKEVYFRFDMVWDE